MKLTRFERQVLRNQHQILELLTKEKNEKEYHSNMQRVYESGFESEYFWHGVSEDEDILRDEDCELVYNIINMYDDLYWHWQKDKELMNAINESDVKFRGFDLNHPFEWKLFAFAEFLIKEKGVFEQTKKLVLEKGMSLNSHGFGPGINGYRQMLKKFELHNSARLKRGTDSAFTVAEMNDIILGHNK